jgi:hypothetical protein
MVSVDMCTTGAMHEATYNSWGFWMSPPCSICYNFIRIWIFWMVLCCLFGLWFCTVSVIDILHLSLIRKGSLFISRWYLYFKAMRTMGHSSFCLYYTLVYHSKISFLIICSQELICDENKHTKSRVFSSIDCSIKG